MTASYWQIGRRIVEFEQGGTARADYGEGLLKRLSADLTARFGRGFSERNLEQMRLFYLGWPISQPSAKSLGAQVRAQIPQTVSGESTDVTISGAVSRKFSDLAALARREGALGIVPPECDGMVVSPEFPVFTVDTDAILPEVLDIYFRTPEVWPTLAEISGGTNMRRRRLQPSAFLNYEMPVPSMPMQRKLRELHRRSHSLKAKHAAIRAANQALLPSTLERVFATVG